MIRHILTGLKNRNEPFRFIGMLIMLFLSLKVWLDIDTHWDTWSYHLPFAARLWGIIDNNHYVFDTVRQTRWEGFPLLGEWLQGFFWAVTQHTQATGYVALFSFFGFCFFLQRHGQVPFYASIIALLAVPLIHFNVTSSYVDLTASLFFSIFLLLLYQALLYPEKSTLRSLVLASICLIIAGNIKVTFAFIGLLTWLSFLLFRKILSPSNPKLSFKTLSCIVILSFPLLFFVPLKNFVLFHNPFQGVEIKIGNTLMNAGENFCRDIPLAHRQTPGPIRWLISVSEIQNPPLVWTADQSLKKDPSKLKGHEGSDWDGMQQAFPYYRMGGFFGAYVLFQLLVFGLLMKNAAPKERSITVGGLVFLTLLAAFSPMSFHLRYTLYWIIILISVNMMRIWQHPTRLLNPTTYSTVTLLTFCLVFWSTGMREIIARKYDVRTFRNSYEQLTHWKTLPKSAVYCSETYPYSLIMTSYFSSETDRDYKIIDAGVKHVSNFKVTPDMCKE